MIKQTVQFYRIRHCTSLEVSEKVGTTGKIVGIRISNSLEKSYIVEFSDYQRLCLLAEEIRVLSV